MRILLPIAGCLLLAGCGSDPQDIQREPDTPRAQPQAAAHEVARPAIVAFGDSLTAGFGVDPGKSYPDVLQQMLDGAGYRYRVVNAGISGDTTSGGLDRMDGIVAMKPAIVILELGANDGLRGLPVETTRANLGEMIRRLEQSGAQVVLAGMTLPRNYGRAYIRSFESVYTGLAQKDGVVLIPFLLAGVADQPRLMQPDRLHPTAEGCRRVAANVMAVLEPLLKKEGEK